jgi:putative peptidoglycan lipid II flippase
MLNDRRRENAPKPVQNIMKFLRSIGLVTLITILSKVLGFLRDSLIAAYFGASAMTDAYFVSLAVPNVLFAAFSTAISSGVIPMYMEAHHRSEEEGKRWIRQLGSFFFWVSLIICVIAFWFSPQIVDIVGGKMPASQRALTIELTKITIPSFIFFVLAAFANGVLNTHKHFFLPSLSSLPNNVLIVLFILFFGDRYGVIGITWCALIAAVTQYWIQLPLMKRYGFSLFPIQLKMNKEVRSSFASFFPIIVASIAVQMNILVDQMVASRLSEGSVSALNYAVKLLYLPLSIVASSLMTVLFPYVVEAAKTKAETFLDTALKGFNLILWISIPIGTIMWVMNKEIIRIVFERGKFDEHDVQITAFTFLCYVPALFSISMRDYLIRSFMAVDRNTITMTSSVLAVPLNIVLCIWLSRYFQSGGIALATSIAVTLQSIFLLTLLIKDHRGGNVSIRSYGWRWAKMAILLMLVSGLTWLTKTYLSFHSLYLSFIWISFVAFALFILFSFLLKNEEWNTIWQMVRQRTQKMKAGA